MSAFEGNVARPNLFHVEMQPPNKSFSTKSSSV